MVDLAGLPVPGTRGEGGVIQQRLECLVPVSKVSARPRTCASSRHRVASSKSGSLGATFAAQASSSRSRPRARSDCSRRTTRSFTVAAANSSRAVAFLPIRPYAPVISALAQRVAAHLADTGVIGRLAVDFLVIRGADDGWQAFALEVNLRMGGTTHRTRRSSASPAAATTHRRASFTTRRGDPRHYVATDHLELSQLPMLGQVGLLARAMHEDLRFDHDRGRGVVFHMLSSIDSLATVGVTAIADAPHTADDLYAHVRTVLARAGANRAVRDRPGARPRGARHRGLGAPPTAVADLRRRAWRASLSSRRSSGPDDLGVHRADNRDALSAGPGELLGPIRRQSSSAVLRARLMRRSSATSGGALQRAQTATSPRCRIRLTAAIHRATPWRPRDSPSGQAPSGLLPSQRHCSRVARLARSTSLAKDGPTPAFCSRGYSLLTELAWPPMSGFSSLAARLTAADVTAPHQ